MKNEHTYREFVNKEERKTLITRRAVIDEDEQY